MLLLRFYPVPYGEDAYGRLFFKDHLFLGHWLPLTQGVVFLLAHFGAGTQAIRLAFAVIAALTGGAFGFYLRQFSSRPAALFGSLLFTLSPLFTVLSLMPYQELPFLGLLFAAFGSVGTERRFQARRLVPASIFFGLACLTRYESWFLIPFLFLWTTFQPSAVRLGFRLIRSGILWGWAPTVWLFLSRLAYGSWDGFLFQTADSAFYAARSWPAPIWMIHYSFRMLYWVGLFGSPLIVLALAGVWRIWKVKRGMPVPLLLGLGQATLALIFYFLVLGREQDTVFRFSALPIAAAITLSAVGFEELCERFPVLSSRSHALPITVLVFVLLSVYSTVPIARLNQDQGYRDPYRIARFLASRIDRHNTALVIADRARDFSDAAPIQYQRIAAQIDDSRNSVFSSGNLESSGDPDLLDFARRKRVRYLVLFRFDPWLASDRFYSEVAISRARLIFEIETARVFRIDNWPSRPTADIRTVDETHY